MGPDNIREAVESGVEMVVAGSAIFGAPSPKESFNRMQRAADEAAAITDNDAISA